MGLMSILYHDLRSLQLFIVKGHCFNILIISHVTKLYDTVRNMEMRRDFCKEMNITVNSGQRNIKTGDGFRILGKDILG